ncbi:hypothetical protein MKW92_009631 [Papaver armeniacum]|nr:hypothetical protein MKW92_009631 [Papaver armeniacum]
MELMSVSQNRHVLVTSVGRTEPKPILLNFSRFSLFLAWMTDRLHHYIRELRLLRKSMEAVKKRRSIAKAMEEELTSLKAKVKKLEPECETKKKDVKAAKANAEALRKQSEGFLLEYDMLLEDNQNLREQLQSLDRGLSHSDSKKNP